MDYRDVNVASKPPLGKTMKPRAPPPPRAPEPAPRHIFRNAVPDGGGAGAGYAKENVRSAVEVHLTLPQGNQSTVTVDGSKALMDLLVELCSRHRLNPSLHTLEVLSPEGFPLGFKPNALLGALDVARLLIKEKAWDEKVARRPAPKLPEKTVRLVVNYHRGQKAVVRVNPLAPLLDLLPVICDKCEFNPEHVLLLKDAIKRHELPLEKTLTQLGIKELYVHNQSLVLQPKMASAPALNYSESVHSSNPSVGGAEKKGLLGMFRFTRRKSKTEEAMDTDGTDDKTVQNTGASGDGLSAVSVVSEARPSTLGQSQSAMNLFRTSPMSESKKRRAPAPPCTPTPTVEHYSMDGYQMNLGSESQQRKRKAPAPPPTPGSTTPTRDSPPMPTPAVRTKVTPSAVASTGGAATPARSVGVLAMTPTPPTPTSSLTSTSASTSVCASTSAPSSPAPSSTTAASLATTQDSSSESGHSMEAESDLDPSGSLCSASGLSTATCTSTTEGVSTPVHAQAGHVPASSDTTTSSAATSGTTEGPVRAFDAEPLTQVSTERSEKEPAATELRMEEAENKRHSAVAWLHSLPSSRASQPQMPDPDLPEGETLSLGNSSSSNSLPDQGYAASEGLVEVEDPAPPTSPWETKTATLNGGGGDPRGGGGGGGRGLGPVKDASSDSDEGCATWGSSNRAMDVSLKEKLGMPKDVPGEECELTSQLDKTLAGFEAHLEDISPTDIVSVKQRPDTISRDMNEVPVSVVDMDIPVTAIDEVLDDYGNTRTDKEIKVLTRSQSAFSKGPNVCQQSADKARNKNNNACSAGGVSELVGETTKPPPQASRCEGPLGRSKSGGGEAERLRKTAEREISRTDVKKNVQARRSEKVRMSHGAVEGNAPIATENKPHLPPETRRTETAGGKEEADAIAAYRSHLGNATATSSVSQSKITRSATSRFGMKTFTVVPPKPAAQLAAQEITAVTLPGGAIKIDEQGNMVPTRTWQRSGPVVGPAPGVNVFEGSQGIGKTKAFWSSSERHDSAGGVTEKHKHSRTDPKNTSVTSETTTKTSKAEHTKNVPQAVSREHTAMAKPEDKANEKADKKAKGGAGIQEGVESTAPEDPLGSTVPQQRDLSFLKPPRRTSSQYVASAISKYTPRPSAKQDGIANILESPAPGKTQATITTTTTTTTVGYQKGGRSIQVNPRPTTQPEQVRVPSSGPTLPSGLKRSVSQPEYISERLKGPEEVRGLVSGLSFAISKAWEFEGANSKAVRPVNPAQVKENSSDITSNIKHTQSRNPSPPPASLHHLRPTKHVTGVNTASQAQVNKNTELTHLAPTPRTEASVGGEGPELQPQATVFGPVKKFRPVKTKPAQQEPCLHSIIMQAIQTGGKDRLKKISGVAPSGSKKLSQAEEENERTALMAAIRAQGNCGRLRKTKSQAAEDIQVFRQMSGEVHRHAPLSTPPPPPPPPPAFNSPQTNSHMQNPPPPLPPPLSPPGPPSTKPPALPRLKSSTGADAQMKAGVAREAMLQAIRSGSAAGRLKKIAAPVKTVQVNGKLGTIRANSVTLPQQ